jgi:uncharacterized iron-regulated membrane protein
LNDDMPEKLATAAPELPKSSGRSYGWKLPARWKASVRTQRAPKPKRTLTATLREWHKRAGLFAFLFMGWLGLSGIALNQSASWGLDTLRIGWPWVMALYGLHPESPQNGYSADEHWIAVEDEHSVLDGKALPFAVKPPIGFAVGGDVAHRLLFVAAYDSLLLLSPQGERVDEVQAGLILPVKSILRIGSVDGSAGMVAIEDQDQKTLFGSTDGESWARIPAQSKVQWSQASALTDGQRKQFEDNARPTVAAEQILIDLHSGRLFGSLGRYVINAVGFAAMLLAISGVWMMWRTNQARRRNVIRR